MKEEYTEDKCPHCGKKVIIRLNIPFFGDQRICGECQQRISGGFNASKPEGMA